MPEPVKRVFAEEFKNSKGDIGKAVASTNEKFDKMQKGAIPIPPNLMPKNIRGRQAEVDQVIRMMAQRAQKAPLTPSDFKVLEKEYGIRISQFQYSC